MGIEIGNLDEFEKRLLDIALRDYPKEAKATIRNMAKKVVAVTKMRTPKGATGNLRKSWQVGKMYRRGSNFWIVVRNIAPHAHLVEDGHRMVAGGKVVGFVPGSHFFERSLKICEKDFPAMLDDFLDKVAGDLKL